MSKEKRNKIHILLIFLILIILFFLIKFRFFLDKESKDKCGLSIYRFEQEFFSIPVDSFSVHFLDIKNRFPSFFMDSTIDFENDVFLDDTLRMVLDSVNLFLDNEIPKTEELEQGFCNYKKYFPDKTFAIYTFIDKAFDYRTPVVFAEGKLFVSLHLFLGQKHSFYAFLPDYIKYSHDVDFLPASCFLTLAGRHIPYPDLDNFLEVILHSSKAYFFTQKMLPNSPEHIVFKSKKNKMEWCHNNEQAIWQYMIEQDYLFSSSTDLIDKFVDLAPFSQFGLATDKYSPGGVGVWLGLQIWNSYVANNDVTLIEVLNETDYMKVLNKSGYKP